MKNLKCYILALHILGYMNVFPQSTAGLNYIKTLMLNRYSDNATYIVNKDYVVFECKQTRNVFYPDMQSFRIDSRPYGEIDIGLDKNGIYIGGYFIKADTSGFKIVGETNAVGTNSEIMEWFWKNNNKVYKDITEISGADASSFEQISMVGGAYFKDKNTVYFHDKKIEGSDPATVGAFSYQQICYDKNNLYVNGEIAYSSNREKLLPVNDVIVKTKKSVFRILGTDLSQIQLVTIMDAASLRGLSRNCAVDKDHIYFNTNPLAVKPKDFKNIKVWDQVNSIYISDGIHFYNDSYLEFDAPSFGMFPNSDFCYDKNGGYQKGGWKGNKSIYEKFPFTYTEPVNENTMAYINGYFVYQHQVYDPWSEDIYSRVHLHTNVSDDQLIKIKSGYHFVLDEKEPVKLYGGGFFVAANKLYYRSTEIKEVNGRSFEFIDDEYVKDKNNVFFFDYNKKAAIVPDADPVTFEHLAGKVYKDKNFVYYGKQKLISNNQVQLLAIFMGERYWHGDEGDMKSPPENDYYLFKDAKGYWFVSTTLGSERITRNYLGTKLNREWNKAFKDFEFPR